MKSAAQQTDLQKTRVFLTAVYKNGDVLAQEQPTPAKVKVQDIPTVSDYKELNLRMVIRASEAEELLEGLVRGKVSISIEQMLSPVERETS